MLDALDPVWAVATVVTLLVCGGIIAFALHYKKSDRRITAKEYVTAIVIIALAVPLTGFAGTAVARASATGGYKEFWGGSIIRAESETITCTKDGPCVHEYDCDPYEETYWVTETYTDAQGKTQTRQVMKTRIVYDACPYATKEYSYWLVDSFGDKHMIASNIFAEDAEEWEPWRARGLPDDVDQGIPKEWQEAKASIEAGDPPPATKINEYDNYLLASQDSILAQYSDSIERYREEGLLPYHTANLDDNPIYDGYKADKVVFAGEKPDNYDTWQQALGRLNSYLGSELQGDLHVLVVPANRIDNPDDYTNTLLAYWQSRELGKNGLAKNAIMLVIGTSADGQTVEWSRADTGIPEGNGEMIAALSSRLDDEPLDPESLIGWPKAEYQDDELTFSQSDGIVEQIIMRDHKFLRPCMACEDADDSGSGYVYLKANAFISTGAKIWISIVFPALIGTIVFGLVAWFDLFRSRRHKESESDNSDNDWMHNRRSRYSSYF